MKATTLRKVATAIVKPTVIVLGLAIGVRAQAQDVENGKKVFVQCSVCHAPDQKNGPGPGLGGIVGRKAGTAPGFRYSRAMKTSGITWNETMLDAYVTEPQRIVPGSVMPFSGVPDAEARRNLISYLKTLR